MKINNDWQELLAFEFTKDYFLKLQEFLDEEETKYLILPEKENRYNALKQTSYKDTKVVIIGQDPYHNINQAHGLAFSVKDKVKLPPSLVNIFKELNNDLQITCSTGNLTSWAKEGVLLLNSVLTVRHNQPNSHKNKGWEIFTNKIISLLNQKSTPVVFILWGNEAKKKKDLITNPIHYIHESPHPSPLSAYNGFFNSQPFSKTNQFLLSSNQKPINWQIK